MSDPRRLTRRAALSGAAATGAGALLGAAPLARAAAGPARGGDPVFAHPLGALAPGTVLTVRPGRRFALVALAWASPAHPQAEIRARPVGAAGYGPWAPATGTGHDGDGVGSATRRGEGLWTGPADALQVRSATGLQGAWLQFVAADSLGDPGDPLGDPPGEPRARAAGLPLAQPILPAGPGQPAIIARSAWAGGGLRPTHGPEYGTIEMAFVHHTENPNGYGPEAVPAMLRAIYAFHVYGRGWWDIGYNFLVDAFGRIWEGRQGGIDLPVCGAQAGDWNSISTGVAMLGSFSGSVPGPAALAALEHLIAWKLSLHGVPVAGDLAAVVPASAVQYTQFRAGELVRLPRLAGHRDGDATACPGDALYAQLPQVRARTERLTGDPATLTVSPFISELPSGPSLTLGGRLAHLGGAPLAGAEIAIELVGGRGRLATALTDRDERFLASYVPRQGGLIRAVHPTAPAAVSSLVPLVRG